MEIIGLNKTEYVVLAIGPQMLMRLISPRDVAFIISDHSGPPSDNRFCFQGNVIKVNRK